MMGEAKDGVVEILDGIRGQISEAMYMLHPFIDEYDDEEDLERIEDILWMAFESCKMAKTLVRQIGETESDG